MYRKFQAGIGISLKIPSFTFPASLPEYAAKNAGNNTSWLLLPKPITVPVTGSILLGSFTSIPACSPNRLEMATLLVLNCWNNSSPSLKAVENIEWLVLKFPVINAGIVSSINPFPEGSLASTLISNCCDKLLVVILFPVSSIFKSLTGFKEKL